MSAILPAAPCSAKCLLDVGLGVVQRARHAGRHRGHPHQHIAAQRRLDRLADLVHRQRKGGVGAGGIGEIVLAESAQGEVGGLDLLSGRELVECLALVDLGARALCASAWLANSICWMSRFSGTL